jgi:hypothetical protein
MFGIPQESVTRINPDAGVNIGMAENANRNSYNASTYGSRMQAKGGMMEGFGSLIGGVAGAIPGIVGAAGKAGKGLFGEDGFFMPSGGSSVGVFGEMGE